MRFTDEQFLTLAAPLAGALPEREGSTVDQDIDLAAGYWAAARKWLKESPRVGYSQASDPA